MYFSAEQVADLAVGLQEVRPKFRALQKQFALWKFGTECGFEHANHGFARRLGVMARSVERVFALLPPDMVAVPERDTTQDATINIQSFVMNAFGCLENIAWIWVHEKGVRQANGQPLLPMRVGLGPSYTVLRSSLTQGFRDHLDQRADWFEHLKDFRDALAHRIPLYIPPFTMDPADGGKYTALELASYEALQTHRFEEFEKLEVEKLALRHFSPIMTHSLAAGAKIAVFHPQLLADFATIEEFAQVLLREL